MRRVVVVAVMVSLFGFGGRAVAQDGDPHPLGENPIGEPVPIYDSLAVEAAQLTVTEVVDDFEDYADFYEPQRNERYVFVVVEIEITGERPYEFQPFYLSLLDSVGHLHSQGFVQRSDRSTVETPELAEANMLPGETVRGGVVYVVPDDATLTQVVYMPFSDVQQLYLVADLTGETSDEATEADAEGTPEA